jgi:hypothetical protein
MHRNIFASRGTPRPVLAVAGPALRSLPTVVILLALVAGRASGQDLTAAPPPVAFPDAPLHARLWQAQALVADSDLPAADLRARLVSRGLAVRADGAIMVVVVGPAGASPVAASLVTAQGGEVRRTWRNRTSAWLPPDRAGALAAALPPGYVLRPADRPVLLDEGPGVVGSDQYVAAGADGSGRTIAVIDAGFARLSDARAAGDAPAVANTAFINYTGTAFEDTNDGTHGTGCVEAAFDHCPGAQWRLYKVAGLTDAGNAVDDAIDAGVDVITHSMAYLNVSWDDDTGGACAMAQAAADGGALFFTAAGNYAELHHEAAFNDPDGDGWHNFAGADELLRITEPANASTSFSLSWDRSGGGFNYDLYLYDDNLNVIASSTSLFEIYESIDWSTSSSTSQDVHLAVYAANGGSTTFEIFEHKAGNWREYETAAGSVVAPSNTSDPNVVAVGAVHWNQFGQPPGSTGVLEDYSSRGPSNSGLTLPDICGPTGTTGTAYPGGFSGTSGATPNVAGAAMAFWSANPDLGATGVRYLLLEQAEIFRDWGAAGDENLHGRGGVQLHEHAPSTSWVDRRVGNTLGYVTLPFFNVGQAVLHTPAGGRIVFLGQAYPEPVNGLAKALTLESIGWSAVLGGVAKSAAGDGP